MALTQYCKLSLEEVNYLSFQNNGLISFSLVSKKNTVTKKTFRLTRYNAEVKYLEGTLKMFLNLILEYSAKKGTILRHKDLFSD